ncbi:MAG: thiamine-phosphate kinase [Burkholderiales bacterium]|nr:thiamine-phosphate kinase [Burkholderiales bacterium]
MPHADPPGSAATDPATAPARSEFALIERYFRRPVHDAAVRLGIGDDAAIVAPAAGSELVLAVDMLVEGRHFLSGADPELLGHKALAVNLSDLAAMGARPRWALLGCALPDASEAWLAAFTRGLFALADRYDVTLVGGDTTRGPRNLCVTVVGELPAGTAITRAGAKAGDDVWVSGTLGDAMLALAAIEGRAALSAASLASLRVRLERPEPRVALGIALRGVASAALDVSDGLTGDLRHILDASRVGATLDLTAIPRSAPLAALFEGAARSADDDRTASGRPPGHRSPRELALACLLAGGDDYELCFTAAPARRDDVLRAAGAVGIQVARIGTVTGEAGLRVRDAAGALLAALPSAFDHFAIG